MKWPKSEERTEIGGVLEQLGALRRKFYVFFLQNFTKKVFPYFQNEVAEIRGENLNERGGLETFGGPSDPPPPPIAKVWLRHCLQQVDRPCR